jgi:spore coat protein H
MPALAATTGVTAPIEPVEQMSAAGTLANSAGATAVAAPVAGTGAAAGMSAVTPPAPAPAPAVTPEPIDEATYLFDPTQLRTYNLVVAPGDLAAIDMSPSSEMYVPAGPELEGKSYGPFRMRYKGSAGAWDAPCTAGGATLATPKIGKCSIKLDFDVDNDGSFYGLKKLNFHSLIQDHSMLRERLGYALFRQMGIAAPRAVHARLLINGKLEGVFLAVEQIDKQFARTHFGARGDGNLYKEVWPTYTDPAVYVAALENNTKHPNVQRMLDFKSAVDTGAAAVSELIDRDYMLRYIAVDRVIINDDGIFHFWCLPAGQGNNPGDFGNHNYYWYEAESGNRFWLIPWDLDFALGARPDCAVIPEWTVQAECTCGYPLNGLQRPASCDKLVSYLKQWLVDYSTQVDAFLAGPFERNRVQLQLDAWTEQIRGPAKEAAGLNGAPTASEWSSAVAQVPVDLASAREHRGRAY